MTSPLPATIEYGNPLAAAHSSTRTVLASAPSSRLAAVTVRYLHKTSGYEIAGSAMRWTKEAYGAIATLPDGTTHGRWYLTAAEARARFEQLTR